MRTQLLIAVALLMAGCHKHAQQPSASAQASQAGDMQGVTPVPVSVDNLTGTWRGSAEGIAFQLIVQSGGQYSEIQTAGALMTQQTGVIQATGPGEVTFVVQDWEPKTQAVYHPTGTEGGYNTQEPMARPAGGTWRVQFNGPNAFTLQDVKLGGIVTFSRVG